MPHLVAQASFNSGEWSPNLYARVDLTKYKAGAALLENFFVDYRGGASTRTGTKYILQAYKSATPVRLISFQASFTVGYVLEFGDGYIRFYYRGSPIIETGIAITAATKANPCVLTIPGHTYSVGEWIYVQGVGGMTQLNEKYFVVSAVVGNNVTIAGLDGTNINSTGYGTYTSGGTASRVYTISSPYTSSDDLRLIKFAQSVNQIVLCHPNHSPYVLTLIAATNWTLVPMVIGATISAPGTPTATGSFVYFPGATPTNYSYGVTSIGTNGQESSMSNPAALYAFDMRTVTGTVKVTWAAVQGAVAYNVYKTQVSYFGVLPVGVQYGFVGTCKDVNFIDSNIAADFTQTPPISKNPFVGSGIDHVTVTTPGTYTTVPIVSFGGSPTIAATAIAVLQVQGAPTISAGGAGFAIGDTVNFGSSLVMLVTNVAAGAITAWSVQSPGYISSGSVPANPFNQISTSGAGTGAQISATWGVGQVVVTGAGAGFGSAPSVIFSSGAAAATAYLGATSNGVPTVPGFVQQRLFLGGLLGAILHAGLLLPERLFGDLAVIVIEFADIRQLHAGEILLREHEIVLHNVIHVQKEGNDRVGLIRRQRAGITEGHRAGDVIERRRGERPERAESLFRARPLERAAPAGEHQRYGPLRQVEIARQISRFHDVSLFPYKNPVRLVDIDDAWRIDDSDRAALTDCVPASVTDPTGSAYGSLCPSSLHARLAPACILRARHG